ncbi:MAG: hypothetical protein LBH19_15210, partial [Dysgonamonadaceae bacterium]|nr:hypothetical protein [Dysgonamonadaceae bacterium]
MIHCFNPGHETAVLNASKHYQPAANQIKMQRELAFLPAWYAEPDDFVWMEEDLTDTFRDNLKNFNWSIQTLSMEQLENRRGELLCQSIDLWGISPQGIHRFEQIGKQYGLHWQIPVWKKEFRRLSSRVASFNVLICLIELIPDLKMNFVLKFVSSMKELEEYVVTHPGRWLVKSPFSSSGRGLVWLTSGLLQQSERQIINGMLKKQSQVSIEQVLDKVMDFSMHFEIDKEQRPRFIGYSVFQTNEKGAYKHSCIANQEVLENQIQSFIDEDLLAQVKKRLLHILQKSYAPYYTGNIGVDMLVYRMDNEYRLHPCVEINMRKSMGSLAIA